MKPEQLLREGKLDEAVQALSEYLRDNPADARSRTFLFELLCFRGDYDRADKQLSLLAQSGASAGAGALLYTGALHAERLRTGMFEGDELPAPLPEDAAQIAGTLNGRPFRSLIDADPRIGARLEVFAAGEYLWVPFTQIDSLQIHPPAKLRDLLWTPAFLRLTSGAQRAELGEVLLPALAPLTFQHPDGSVRLGRVTEWCADERGRERPYGQKMLLADGEEIPLLEVRSLEVLRTEAVGQ